jgi:hypothetical protein
LFGVARGGLLPLILILGTLAAYAGDEDMSPSAYHVFDPVTGYMITVDPLDEEQQDSVVPDEIPPEVESTVSVHWRFWIAAIAVSGGIAFWLHRRRESHD